MVHIGIEKIEKLENAKKDDFERKKTAGNVGWKISVEGSTCSAHANGACWESETSPNTFYRDIVALTGGNDGPRDFTVSCRFGLTNEKWNYVENLQVVEKGNDIGICRNGNYSLRLYDCGGVDDCGGRTAYGLSALYNPHLYDGSHEKSNLEPFLATYLERGETGTSKPNGKDAGCRHLSFFNLPVRNFHSKFYFSLQLFFNGS